MNSSNSSFSVLILTYNEEKNLLGCFESLEGCDDVVVLDSNSSDKTIEIAKKYGAKVLQRSFDNYAAQRNYGLAHDFKHDWILMLDADERIDDEVRKEIDAAVSLEANPVTLYRIRRKDMFMGRWIKRSSGYPTWFGRLFKKGAVRVEREINEEYYTDGEVGYLNSHLIHYPFNKGIEYWYQRHNRYSSMEAKKLYNELNNEKVIWKDFFNKDPMMKRKAFKQFAYRMPMRPFLTFCFLYFFRGGILDGTAGLKFSLMRASYEFMIDLKIDEIKQKNILSDV